MGRDCQSRLHIKLIQNLGGDLSVLHFDGRVNTAVFITFKSLFGC